MSQITTLTLFKYKGFRNKSWAFWMMQFAHKPLLKVKGLSFYKLMGSGKAAFNPMPDWSVYALLQIWDDELCADSFFKDGKLFKKYQVHTTEQITLYLKCIQTRGEWSGKNPFIKSNVIDADNKRIAVVTRATIKPLLLRKFWKYVPYSQKSLEANKGLLYTKGIGEVPLTQMATFSVWESVEALNAFAYQSKNHVGAIKKTRKLDWYKEELFSRFQPYKSLGSWRGLERQLGIPNEEIDKKQ